MSRDRPSVDIRPSALRHGVHEADIRHALAHPMSIEVEDDGVFVIVGSRRDGHPLEMCLRYDAASDTERVFHAMQARPNRMRKSP